jgi:hypothetical protein
MDADTTATTSTFQPPGVMLGQNVGQKRQQEQQDVDPTGSFSVLSQKMPRSENRSARVASGDHLPEISPDEIQLEKQIGEGSFGKV